MLRACASASYSDLCQPRHRFIPGFPHPGERAHAAPFTNTHAQHTQTLAPRVNQRAHARKQTSHAARTNAKPGVQINAKKSCRLAPGEWNSPATDAGTTCPALFGFRGKKKIRFASTL